MMLGAPEGYHSWEIPNRIGERKIHGSCASIEERENTEFLEYVSRNGGKINGKGQLLNT